jgi:hypothetical protein
MMACLEMYQQIFLRRPILHMTQILILQNGSLFNAGFRYEYVYCCSSCSENRIQNDHLEQESASDIDVTNGAADSH